jgi:hypothetical protein
VRAALLSALAATLATECGAWGGEQCGFNDTTRTALFPNVSITSGVSVVCRNPRSMAVADVASSTCSNPSPAAATCAPELGHVGQLAHVGHVAASGHGERSSARIAAIAADAAPTSGCAPPPPAYEQPTRDVVMIHVHATDVYGPVSSHGDITWCLSSWCLCPSARYNPVPYRSRVDSASAAALEMK